MKKELGERLEKVNLLKNYIQRYYKKIILTVTICFTGSLDLKNPRLKI